MTDVRKIDKRITWFVGEMKRVLNIPKNSAKGDWRNEKLADLYQHLLAEVVELGIAIHEGYDYEVVSEACDVAAMAMMVADKKVFAEDRGGDE